MGSNMTLGKRISMGFAILVAITLVLGIIGVVNMRNAAAGADKLANVYAPEIQVASDIFRTANQARYNIRAFTMADNEAALATAKKEFSELKTFLDEAEALGKKYQLKALLEKQGIASKALVEYVASVERSEKILANKKKSDATMTVAAPKIVENIESYIASVKQNQVDELKETAVYKDRVIERMDKIILANQMAQTISDARVAGQRALIRNDVDLMQKAINRFPFLYKSVQDLIGQTRNPKTTAILKTIESESKAYEGALKELVVVIQETAKENAMRIKSAAEVINSAEAVVNIGLKNVDELSKESDENLDVASLIMIVGLILAVIISIAVAIFIIRSIVKILTESVKSLSEGTTQVVSASEQISSASVSLAEGASSQASSVEEVSATIEEATASNNQNAENSREANLLAQHSNDAAKVGNQRVQDLMGAMEKITDSSQKIAKIIKTIDEIAFQTNLLALNAAVEAARAGEHGLGFAVVAEEVKNLAERSAGAAKEITGIIEASIDQVKAGTEVANKTKESFTEILNGIKKTSDLIGEIAISAKEQAEGMNQIATAMGSVDQITQQNASASEETAAAAEELNAQALSMLDNVSELAMLAGYDMGKENRSAPKTTKRLSDPVMAPKRLGMNTKKPMSKPSSTATSRRNNEEVFPLGEDDLKEF
ncbi:MAG: methyl-accepting chemotaxis protein [Sulfurospirillum sp.]|nr:methyl-accepting chemotaxis protein [Sulfurospirillum sp.]